jgi:hypothetical protein
LVSKFAFKSNLYRYCVDLEHAADVRRREAEAGEVGGAVHVDFP